MKKLLFSAFLTLSFSLSFAQIGDFLQDVQWGVKAGLNYSRIANIHSESKGRFGFNAGGFAIIPISYDNQYYIQPELSYSQKGENNDVKAGKEVYQLDYIDLPILFKAYFSDRDSDFFGLIGPQFSFLVNDNIKNKVPENLDAVYNYHKDQYTKFDFSLAAGVGYSYERKYEVGLRVEYGLTDAVKGESRESDKINNNGVISLNFSYIF